MKTYKVLMTRESTGSVQWFVDMGDYPGRIALFHSISNPGWEKVDVVETVPKDDEHLRSLQGKFGAWMELPPFIHLDWNPTQPED